LRTRDGVGVDAHVPELELFLDEFRTLLLSYQQNLRKHEQLLCDINGNTSRPCSAKKDTFSTRMMSMGRRSSMTPLGERFKLVRM
jgi:hypothetical protein